MSTLRLSLTEATEPDAATFDLTGQAAVIGRDGDADLVVAESSVSGRHARFVPAGRGYTFVDLGSTNGSVLVRDGVASPCAANVPVPLGAGDTLLLGDRSRPVTVHVTAADGAPALTTTQRTVIAHAPLVDLLAPAGLGELASLAARVMTVSTPSALAALGLELAARVAPNAGLRGVALWGPHLAATAGTPIPQGLVEAAMNGLTRAEILSDQSNLPLPQTSSLAEHGTRAALVVPLVTRGALSWGLLYAASPLGPEAFPPRAVDEAAIGGSLLALGASELSRRLEADLRSTALITENRRLAGDAPEPIGRAKVFTDVLRMATQVAATDVPLLFQGETGTGKEVFARHVHRMSLRATKPFVAFNCAAIPEHLIESELFGYQRGAFTGANIDRRGLFEEAHQGTLFLDEIGEMPALMQAKLLRVLQDGEVRRLGANKPVHVDVRVISATHRDLPKRVAEGTFRADLMYRLNAVTLHLPALRDRGDDVVLIAHVLLSRAAAQCRKQIPGFTPEALWALSSYAFPGNIRELDNELLRAAALTPDGDPIGPEVFSDALRSNAPTPVTTGTHPSLKDAVAQAERRAIEAALSQAQGNVSEAARLLGVTRPGLYKAMERLQLR